MPKIGYRPWPSKAINPEHRAIIERADAFAREYAAQGYGLTLRQLYYRFVASGLIANKQSEYNRLGALIADARYAGLIDWRHLEDRTRNVHTTSFWDDAPAIVRSTASAYTTEKWAGQPMRLEIWVEKDALLDVVARSAQRYGVAYFSCRGYTSSSEMWNAAQRIVGYMSEDVDENYDEFGYGVQPRIIHLGDHDPSGIDMTIDIESRLLEFIWRDAKDRGLTVPGWLEPYGEYQGYEKPWEAYSQALVLGDIEPILIERIALNLDQIRQYNPPPNPAKTTDSRLERYTMRTGLDQSWELDALEPQVLDTLITSTIRGHIIDDLYNQQIEKQKAGRRNLSMFGEHYDEIMQFGRDNGWTE